MKFRIILAIFAMTFLLEVQAHASYLAICNKTGKTLWMARAYECCYFSGEPVQWYTLGWENIPNEDCYRQGSDEVKLVTADSVATVLTTRGTSYRAGG
jgi:uncharacterized membrane protein